MSLLLSHLNTILFGILSMGVCVLLMFLLLTPSLQGFFVFFLTTGIGLTIVTMAAMIALVNDTTTANAVQSAVDNISVITCPDYFGYVKEYDANNVNGVHACTSSNLLYNPVLDKTEQITFLKFVGDKNTCGKDIPTLITLGGTGDNNYQKKSDAKICELVSGSVDSTIKYIPWTRVRPFCPRADPYPL